MGTLEPQVAADAQTVDGAGGIAMTAVTLSDSQGTFGWSHQSLLIEPRSLPQASTL